LKLKYRIKTKQYKVYALQFHLNIKYFRIWIFGIIFKPFNFNVILWKVLI